MEYAKVFKSESQTVNLINEREARKVEPWQLLKIDLLFRCPGCGNSYGYREGIMFNARSRCPDCAHPFVKPDNVTFEQLHKCMER